MLTRFVTVALFTGALVIALTACTGATPTPTPAPSAPPTPAPTAPPTPMPTATPSAAEAFVDSFTKLWMDKDETAARDVYDANAVIVDSNETGGVEEQARGIEAIATMVRNNPLRIVRIGPIGETANLIWYPARISYGDSAEAVVVLEMLDGKIIQHWVIWEHEQ